MLKALIQQLMQKENLTQEQCQNAVRLILDDADPLQVAAFLVLLHAKGETADEMAGIVKAMRDSMVRVPINNTSILDIVGTGGDGAHTINISTAASILVASVGVKVAKHGNRAVSSNCGSADLLEALGIKIDMSPDHVKECIENIGIGFCFAPAYHPATQKVKSIRSRLGVRTTFNLLGPLLNPASASHYLLGVYSEKHLNLIADCLQKLAVTHALVVSGQGLDELSLLGPAKVVEIRATEKREYELDPKDFGFDYCQLSDIQGGDPQKNAQLVSEIFDGKQGAMSDNIIFNAGVGLYVADHVTTIAEGIALARENLRQGKVLELIQKWIDFGNSPIVSGIGTHRTARNIV